MENLYKYPRTAHFNFSEGATSDDKIMKNSNIFIGKTVVITEKMDGENTTIYRDYYHSRSLDSKHREYHSYLLTKILPLIQYQIPNNWRLCGEYLYAKHSIKYNDLEDYFLLFSIWNENNNCLNWEDTKKFSELLGLKTVPELYIGKFDEELVKKLAKEIVLKGGEGLVVRNFNSFNYDEFSNNIAKFVRANHVQTENNWANTTIEKNELKKKEVVL